MRCCCTRVLNLCKVPVCGTLVIEKLAVTGSPEATYDLVIDFLQSQITLTEEQTDGENIHFDVSKLNESFEYTGKIYDANGDEVTITVDGLEYDCVKFKTVLNVSL